MQKKFKLRDKVFDIRYGWGEVVSTENGEVYPIRVEFSKDENRVVKSYTEEGRENTHHTNSSLSHLQYGSESTSEYPKMMWVWDIDIREMEQFLVVGEFIENGRKSFISTSDEYDSIENYPNDIKAQRIHWLNAKDVIEEQIELTMQEIADKFDIPLKSLRIKD